MYTPTFTSGPFRALDREDRLWRTATNLPLNVTDPDPTVLQAEEQALFPLYEKKKYYVRTKKPKERTSAISDWRHTPNLCRPYNRLLSKMIFFVDSH